MSLEKFGTFADNVELNLDTIEKNSPFLIVLLGDLNAKLHKWYEDDSTSDEDNKSDGITSQFGIQ